MSDAKNKETHIFLIQLFYILFLVSEVFGVVAAMIWFYPLSPYLGVIVVSFLTLIFFYVEKKVSDLKKSLINPDAGRVL